ncbi:1069_t:CDS:2 [Acaulospora colombiana]|uniref:1069_t:CDS:1 n=1 Tax=Acaulospora colombiana TaxID=27376 RepID=A0ACA9NU58_9GLOM|nr:1069_t:CDS:2 [Acaulospora colombiana]
MRYIRKRYPPQVLPPVTEDEDDLTEYDWVEMKRAAKKKPVLYEIWIDIQNRVMSEDATAQVGSRGARSGKGGWPLAYIPDPSRLDILIRMPTQLPQPSTTPLDSNEIEPQHEVWAEEIDRERKAALSYPQQYGVTSQG